MLRLRVHSIKWDDYDGGGSDLPSSTYVNIEHCCSDVACAVADAIEQVYGYTPTKFEFEEVE